MSHPVANGRPVRLANGYYGHGKTGARRPDGRCSECVASGFCYSNGFEWSRDGVRGYRCMTCGTIKPEARVEIGANNG